MNKINSLSLICSLAFLIAGVAGCGYTTRGFLNPEYKTIYVKPVDNRVRFTGESQEYGKYRSIPPLVEDRFTQAVLSRVNLDGTLKPSDRNNADLVLETQITDYVRDTLRYDDEDRIEEYRLKLYYTYQLYDSNQDLVNKSSLIADAEFVPGGAGAEDEAVSILLEDAARRIVEDIIEIW